MCLQFSYGKMAQMNKASFCWWFSTFCVLTIYLTTPLSARMLVYGSKWLLLSRLLHKQIGSILIPT